MSTGEAIKVRNFRPGLEGFVHWRTREHALVCNLYFELRCSLHNAYVSGTFSRLSCLPCDSAWDGADVLSDVLGTFGGGAHGENVCVEDHCYFTTQ